MSIKPLAHAENITKNFVTLDIENKPDGTVYSIDTCWRDSENVIKHCTLDNWQNWYEWILLEAKYDDKFRTIYAHNGGAWDWSSFVEYYIDNHDSEIIDCIMANSRVIAIQIYISDIEGNYRISLCDSLYLIRSSLDNAANKFLGKRKVEVDINNLYELKTNNYNLYLKYVYADTELLLEVMEKFSEIVHYKIAPLSKLGLTLPSTALKIFRTTLTDEITIPQSETVKDFLRGGYRGGRVEVFKYGEFNNISVYDINSLYPAMMKFSKVPLSSDGYFTIDYESNSVGFWEIDFKQSEKYLPALLVKGNGEYSGSGIYTTAEVNNLIKYGGDFEVINGFVFDEVGYLFSDLITKLYDLRMTDKYGPLGEVCKLIMNSLYGKFGQKSEAKRIAVVNDISDINDLLNKSHSGNDEPVSLTEINAEKGIYAWHENILTVHEHVGIAATITGNARAYLYNAFCDLPKKSIIYCDTDSIHINGEYKPKNVGDNLGEFKKEFSGFGVYAGKKLYALKDKATEKIRVKGVRVAKNSNDDLGAVVNYDIIKRLIAGDCVECTYKTPASFLEVLKGKKSCKFGKRKRRIRMTEKTANIKAS